MGPLLSNELAMPTENSVGGDERSNLGEGASPDGLAANRKPATLIIGQPESSATELLLENSVLLAEIINDGFLVSIDPAGQGSDEDLPGVKDGGHRLIVATPRNNRQLSAGGETE